VKVAKAHDRRFTVVITGGASGIGLATAKRVIAAGGHAAILDLDKARADAARKELGPKGMAAACDVTDEASLRGAVTNATKGAPPVTGLVCAAGCPPSREPLETMDLEHWSRVVATHLTGTMLACRVVGSALAQRGRGAIVTISSVTAERPGPALDYSAAKAGVANLTQALAAHWGAKGVRVNAVAPGWTDTPFIRQKGRDHASVVAAMPIGRLIKPEEIAEVIWFLLSPASSAIIGSFIPCDGGYMAAAGWAPYGGFPRS